MLTVRLDKDTELHLDRVARIKGVSRSELVREAIDIYLSKYRKPSAFNLGCEVFGKYGSGGKDLSEKRKDGMSRGTREKWNG
jgi:hypothetical protein